MQKIINRTNYKSLALLGKTSIQLNALFKKGNRNACDLFCLEGVSKEACETLVDMHNVSRNHYQRNLIYFSSAADNKVRKFAIDMAEKLDITEDYVLLPFLYVAENSGWTYATITENDGMYMTLFNSFDDNIKQIMVECRDGCPNSVSLCCYNPADSINTIGVNITRYPRHVSTGLIEKTMSWHKGSFLCNGLLCYLFANNRVVSEIIPDKSKDGPLKNFSGYNIEYVKDFNLEGLEPIITEFLAKDDIMRAASKENKNDDSTPEPSNADNPYDFGAILERGPLKYEITHGPIDSLFQPNGNPAEWGEVISELKGGKMYDKLMEYYAKDKPWFIGRMYIPVTDGCELHIRKVYVICCNGDGTTYFVSDYKEALRTFTD